MKGLCKSMDHKDMMGEICGIVDERWGDGGMWECCGMERNQDQWLHTPNWIFRILIGRGRRK